MWVWANFDSCPKYNEHRRQILFKLFKQIKLIWHSKDYTYTWTHIYETIIFELGQLRHRVERIGLAHSQYQVLPPMTVFARHLETILVMAWQDVVNGPTKSRVLGPLCKFPWTYWISYKYTFSVQTRRTRETLLEQYCTNNGVFVGYIH